MASKRPWFVIAGGGTGGHLYPGLAVAEALIALQPDFEVTVFGTQRPIDRQLTQPRGFELVAQEVRAFPRRPLAWPGFLAAWFRSVKAARRSFERRAPAVVLGLGGYAAGPAVVAAARLGIPTALFNPDAVPGRANARLGPRVDRVFVQWEATCAHFPRSEHVKVTGCPIRSGFSRVNREHALRSLKLDAGRRTLLITGASQGARSINRAALELLELWRVAREWQILHLTGDADLETCRAAYRTERIDARTEAYTEQMPLCMAAADVVLSRAGASTLAEITAMGVPSVLMPYPFDRRRHQHANARVLADEGAAEVVEDANDPRENSRRLLPILRDLMKSDERRRRMAKAAAALGRFDAAQTIAEELFEMARRG
jgi:UDP-N-acetylglucosamine--N-acetylmuramyl-(pentapeptide) pyrophosphoryl-undecaprenol N-acetylglucosamine transferase